MKSLSHDLSRWDSIKPKANGKELIPIILANMIKVSFSLTQKTNEGSKDFMIFYMWLFTLTKIVNKFVQSTDSDHFADHGQAHMAYIVSIVFLDIGNEHVVLPLHPLGAILKSFKIKHNIPSLLFYFKSKM
ncbi:hypothetical protein MASR1M90_04870 [Desulfovibrionales bacterium]